MIRFLFSLVIAGLTACVSFSGPTKVQRDVVFKDLGNGKSLKADIYFPKTPGIHPGVVVVHGGGWIIRSGRMESICKKLARAGFVAFNATYRLAPETRFPDSVDDVRDSIHYFQTHAQEFGVDRARISAWGYSAGAHMILLAAVDGKMGIRAIVAGAAPTDLTAWPESSLVLDFLGVKLKDNPALWREASPVNHITEQTPPIFLYHGGMDNIVEIDQMHRLEKALIAKHRPYKTYIAEWLGHFSVYLFSSESDSQALDFLRENAG